MGSHGVRGAIPIGLLALAAGKREDMGTIVLTDAGDGSSDIRVAGLFDRTARSRIERKLSTY